MCTQTKTKPIFVQELSRQNLKSIMCQADYVQSLGQLDERLWTTFVIKRTREKNTKQGRRNKEQEKVESVVLFFDVRL